MSESATPPPAHTRLAASERREQLIHVAIDLFSRKGFKGTTTREIAAAAGVTEAIIFRHFETKEHLYTAIIDQKLNSPQAAKWVAALLQAMDRDDDEAVIRELIGAIFTTSKTDPKFERLMLYAALEGNEIALLYMRQVTASIVDVFRSYFLRRQKQGHLRPFPPDLVLAAIVGMAQHYALNKYVHEFNEKCSDAQALDTFTRITMDGVRVPQQPKTPAPRKKR
jgi:TetR/AcrR family transcriptional regulator